jgi:hypothetical protein
MITKEEQKLIQKWIKNYSYKKFTKEMLQELYNEDYAGKGTPRRLEDKARKKALLTLLN